MLKKNTLKSSKKYYTELDDTPLYVWEKVLEGNYNFMRKERKEKATNDDVIAFYKLYDKYLRKYGLSKQHQKYMDKLHDIVLLKLEYLETGDKFKLTQIEISKSQLKDLKPKENGLTIGQQVIVLSKWMGQWIDKKKITVTEYKDLISEYERAH